MKIRGKCDDTVLIDKALRKIQFVVIIVSHSLLRALYYLSSKLLLCVPNAIILGCGAV